MILYTVYYLPLRGVMMMNWKSSNQAFGWPNFIGNNYVSQHVLWDCSNLGYLLVTFLKLKYHQQIFVHILCVRYQILFKLYPHHNSDSFVLCAKFQNDQTNA